MTTESGDEPRPRPVDETAEARATSARPTTGPDRREEPPIAAGVAVELLDRDVSVLLWSCSTETGRRTYPTDLASPTPRPSQKHRMKPRITVTTLGVEDLDSPWGFAAKAGPYRSLGWPVRMTSGRRHVKCS